MFKSGDFNNEYHVYSSEGTEFVHMVYTSLLFIKNHNKKLRSNFIVRHLDNWRINWDLFIIILAIYNAI